MKTVAVTSANYNPGALKNVPVVGVAKVMASSRNRATAVVRQHLVPVYGTATTKAMAVGSKPLLSKATIVTDCQFKSFHKAKFAWR